MRVQLVTRVPHALSLGVTTLFLPIDLLDFGLIFLTRIKPPYVNALIFANCITKDCIMLVNYMALISSRHFGEKTNCVIVINSMIML